MKTIHTLQIKLIVTLTLSILLCSFTLGQATRYAALSGDTILLKIDNPQNSNIHWQERTQYFENWKTISITNQNDIQIICSPGDKYYRAVIYTKPDTCPAYSSQLLISTKSHSSQLQPGDLFAGGIFFHFDGINNYILSPLNPNPDIPEPRLPWGCRGDTIRGANGLSIGSGFQNTLDILKDCPQTSIAAYYCDTLTRGGYTDWYLPSIGELESIRRNIDSISLKTNFVFSGWVASSTEFDDLNVYLLDPRLGSVSQHVKDFQLYVHAIRSQLTNKNYSYSIKLNALQPEYVVDVDILYYDSIAGRASAMYVGEGDNMNNYIWDFSGAKLISGDKRGPFELEFNFGGYNQIYVKNQSSNCPEFKHRSPFIKFEYFKDLQLKIPHVDNGCIEWGDYNNDGLLDIFLTGMDHAKIYKNMGNDSFRLLPLNLPPVDSSFCDWGDVNNDGLLDIIYCGVQHTDSNLVTRIFINNGNDQFQELSVQLPGVKAGFVKFVDYNKDGFMDIVFAGENKNQQAATHVFKNNKDGSFTEIHHNIVHLKNSNGAFGDYNQDGYPDLIILGRDSTHRITKLYKNEKGNFVDSGISLTGVDEGEAVWIDYDSDGWLDFSYSGNKADPEITTTPNSITVTYNRSATFFIYKNLTGNDFSNYMNLERIGAYAHSSMSWGDVNNDGLLDYTITGVPGGVWWYTSGSSALILRSGPRLYTNIGNNLYFDFEANIPRHYGLSYSGPYNPYHPLSPTNSHVTNGLISHHIRLGDYDNDGDLDIIREGNYEGVTSIYKNVMHTSNQIPSAPNNIQAKTDCNQVALTWNEAIDDHTNSKTIYYEIYIGKTPGQGDVFSKSNKHYILGNEFKIDTINPGTYYWSVKAVDQAQSASAYAPEQSFTISAKPATPVISFNGSSLLSNAMDGNQWHDQNGPIPGATQQSYIPAINGSYYVIVSSNGCQSDTSNIIQVMLSANDNQEANQAIKVYPNPVEDVLTLETSEVLGTIPFEITNSFGQVIYEGILNTRIQLSTKDFPAGLYTIKFQTEKLMLIKNLIKE